MSELRYPNESREYRDARESLLKDEQELVDKVRSVAERRRNLPPGGQLKEDYVFQWANDGKVGKSVKFSELFADKNTLLLYSFMYGPSWDNPCPSCTSLVDGFDRTWYQVTQDASFVAIAKAPAERINAWAKQRGWSQIALVSGSQSAYQADYKCQGDSDDMQLPSRADLNSEAICKARHVVFTKRGSNGSKGTIDYFVGGLIRGSRSLAGKGFGSMASPERPGHRTGHPGRDHAARLDAG